MGMIINPYISGAGVPSSVLLVHCDGSDTSTTFTDSSASGHTLTASGNAQVDTAFKVFGTGSLLCDGTTDFVYASDHANWDFASDLTIDCRWRPTALIGAMWSHWQDANNYMQLVWGGIGGITFIVVEGGSTTLNVTQGSSSGWSTDTWYHVALVRFGNEWDIYRDGTSVASATDSITMPSFTGDVRLGALSATTEELNGHLDEIRVVNGTAAWETNFTPPIAPYTS